MTININQVQVLEAQQIIEETKNQLILFVKKYFEGEALREANWTVNSRVNSEYTDFIVKIHAEEEEEELEKLCIKVDFSYNTEDADWTYRISCPELKIYSFEPPTKNELTIQGKIFVELKERSTIRIGGEDISATVEYRQEMQMRKYLD